MHICSERLGLLPNPSLTWTDFAETCINTVEQVCLQPEDEYGSPSLDEIALFSHHFSEEYHRAIGEAAEEVAVEVSSPVSLSMQIPRLQVCRLGCRWACKPAAYAYVHVVFQGTIAHAWACKSGICASLCLSHLTLFVAPSNTAERSLHNLS